ncbi:MAG: hypothetical protein II736_03045 [Clostridia bacterium]|nr:hypothetical protein [Clostridia bacterium]
MKHLSKLLAAVMVVSMIVTALAMSPAALDSGDWQIVHHSSGSPANADMSTTDDGGIRLTHEGHYPSTNAGLLYTKGLDIYKGVSINVTVETDNSASSDVWYGVTLMNRPVYFDAMGGVKSEDDGFGIVLLARPSAFQWMYVDTAGFNQKTSVALSDMEAGKDYYGEGINVTFEFKVEDEALHVYVDNVLVDADFSDLLKSLVDDQVYVGFSMSQTEGEFQSFVINTVNGEKAASEGDRIDPTVSQGETTVDPNVPRFEDVSEFVLADFTDPELIKGLTANDCKLSLDETEGALKVEVTGSDPYFNVPMKKAMFFDGSKFTVAKLEYKTDVEEFTGEFFFTTKEVPSMALCNLQYDLEATGGNWEIFEQDMDEQANWMGEVRSFRIDPMTEGEEGKVFYYKSLVMAEWVEPETDPSQNTTKAPDTEPDTSAATDTDKGNDTTPDTTKSGTETKSTEEKGKSNVGLIIGIVAGVVVVAAAVACGIILSKKKKA